MDENLKAYFKVLRCDTKTGILLNADNEPILGNQEKYNVFNDLDEAKSYIEPV